MFEFLSFNAVLVSLTACLALREVFVIALPDTVAGPGGWLVDTTGEE